MARIVVTGAAGFIGYHSSERLLADGHEVIGYDNLNSYYDPSLKQARLKRLAAHPGFRFVDGDLADGALLRGVFDENRPQRVLHLAAQAGVRYSIDHPFSYVNSNLIGFATLLEACRAVPPEHLVFASSSSVYGSNRKLPFSVDDGTDHPISLYAATKKSNEAMAHAYAHLYGIPTTGLRFFTVYGPWGRPDMAYYAFTRAILAGEPIKVFNGGELMRDFTYIDDVVTGIVRLLDLPAAPDPHWNAEAPNTGSSNAPYRLYNIGNHSPVKLMDFIRTLESAIGRDAVLEMAPMAAGDVHATFADVEPLAKATGFSPDTPIATGLQRFVDWYRDYHGA